MHKLVVVLITLILICVSDNVHVASKNVRPQLQYFSKSTIVRAVYEIHFRNGTVSNSNIQQSNDFINQRGLSLHSSKYVLCQKPEIPKIPTVNTTNTNTNISKPSTTPLEPAINALNLLPTQLAYLDSETDL